MARVLINDGIHPTGEKMMKDAGLDVVTDFIPQDELMEKLPSFDAICVRSATKVRQDLIANCPNLKIIARGGVGLDNIDVQYARDNGVEVYNTPAASSRSVAELAITHIMNLSRGVNQSNREMPIKGHTAFKDLKKSYSKGVELEGKTLGIIGFGRIGQELAKIGLGMGMNILPVDPMISKVTVPVGPSSAKLSIDVNTVALDEMLSKADYISLHVPSGDKPVLGNVEMEKMKNGVTLINTARGGSIDEDALLANLKSGKIRGVGLDVFVNEPSPREDLLAEANTSLTPHIGASTAEAQEKIGIELADQIIAFFNR